jgi:D-alanine-D-alanine ligase
MERDVSIKSGAMIAKALRENGHKAVLVDAFFGYKGEYNDPKEIFDREPDDSIAEIPDEVPDLNKLKEQRTQKNNSRIGDNLMEVCGAADIVFLALHGGDGEDGRLQAAFDIAGVRYTGSGYMGSAIAMNKAAAKDMFIRNGITTPEGKVINVNDSDKSYPCLPCVVKPKSSGSSVGTSIAHTPEEFTAALDLGFKYEDDILCERYIKGREIDVGVIKGKALPPIEICPKSGFFDYKNKYQSGMTDEYCPADISEELKEKLMEAAVNVFNALYLEVYARMDFIVEETTGTIYCLEANTLPGMTPASLLPKEAKVAGIDYNTLCETIITESLKRFEE